ncbi:condensation domain-containing protein, partial [Planctobacterium marinum]
MTIGQLIDSLHVKGVSLSLVEGKLQVAAAKGKMTQEILQLIRENKASILDFLYSSNSVMDIPIVKRDQPLPLSYAQKRLWVLDQIEPGQSQYNIPASLVLEGKLDVDALEGALNDIVDRHESLRTTFMSDDGGEPYQVIHEAKTLQVQQA